MAITTEQLIVQLEARIDKYEKNLAKAAGTTDKQFRRIEARGKKLEKSFDAIGGRLVGVFAGVASVRGVQNLIDASTRIQNSLKVAGLEGEELTTVYNELFTSAQKSAAPLEALVELYGRASLVQKELGVSSSELLNFTDKIAVALRVSGKSASESSGALLQLSQALGSGVVRAEEFNSILEGALPIAQAAAAGLDEAGGSVSKLRELVVDGKVSSEAFFRAFEAGAVILEDKVAGAELTTSQAFTRLTNVLIDTAGKMNDTTGASERFIGVVDRLSDAIEGFGATLDEVADSQIGRWVSALTDAYDKTASFVELLGGIPGLIKTTVSLQRDLVTGNPLGNAMQQDRIASRLDAAFNVADPKTERLPKSEPTNIGTVKPVTLKNYRTPPSSQKGGGGSKDKQNDFQREVDQIKERTAALQAETVAMTGLNPLVEDYGYSLEKARAVQELTLAAQKAGIEITPQLTQQINNLAEGYATASVEGEKLAESQDKIRESSENMQELYGEMGSIVGDTFSQIANGSISAEEGLKRMVIQLIAAYAQAKLLEALGLGSGSGGGFLGGIIGAISGARAAGGPVNSGESYLVGEKGPEIFTPNSGGMITPNNELNSVAKKVGGAASSKQNINITVQVDGANGDQHVIDLVNQGVSQGLSKYDKYEAPNTARSAVKGGQRAGIM